MKRWLLLAFSFLAGAFVASAAWAWHFYRLQAEYAAGAAGAIHSQAGAGEQILQFLDEPHPDKAPRLAFMASNMVNGFLVGIDMCDERWPYLHMRRRHSSEYLRFEQFLKDRQARSAQNGEQTRSSEPGDAALVGNRRSVAPGR